VLPTRAFASPRSHLENMSSLITKHFSRGLLTEGSHVRNRSGEPVRFFEHKPLESAANQLNGCRSNRMHGCNGAPHLLFAYLPTNLTAGSAQLPTSCALSAPPQAAFSLKPRPGTAPEIWAAVLAA
jgi:hypothetical protein